MNFLLLFVYICLQSSTGEIFKSVPSKLEQIVYLYPNQIKDEKELPQCGAEEVCGTEHKRFWFPSWIKRFCRCQKGECSKAVSILDNRSQIRVCSIPLKEECPGEEECRETCYNGEVGLEIRRDQNVRPIVKLKCNCEAPAYWTPAARTENSTLVHESFACYKLKSCKSGDFCGHIRADTYSMYLHCTCPKDHICLNREKSERNISEALYQGFAMRAYCLSMEDNFIS